MTATMKTIYIRLILIFSIIIVITSCEQFVKVDEVKDRMLAEQVFENKTTANAAIAGIYKTYKTSFPAAISQLNPMISDELTTYLNAATNNYVINNLQVNDTTLPWARLYSVIFGANNAIEKLSNSTAIDNVSKQLYIGEAKFLRAFAYFYLVNLFGDVPLILTTNVQQNSVATRTPSEQVYSQIILDLKEATRDLPLDYAHGNNERIRANHWVAKSLLARVYLYRKMYTDAEREANDVIGSNAYTLLNTPVGIWAKNNTEAIWQLANNPTENNNPVASGFLYTSAPTYKLTESLLNAFEVGDLRRSTWIQNRVYQSNNLSIPFKLTSSTTNPPEYYTLIRLAELYLIRAEARAFRDDFQGCADDIDLIRQKHGGLTTPVLVPSNFEQALDLILHERRVEFFTEGMHRWFDLKRTDRLNSAMMQVKPTTWNDWAAWYPIPLTETQRNTKMTQNTGYEQQ